MHSLAFLDMSYILSAFSVGSVSIEKTRIISTKNTLDSVCGGIAKNMVYSQSNLTIIGDVSFSNDLLPSCGDLVLVNINAGDLLIYNCSFFWGATHIILNETTLNATGENTFYNGMPAIKAYHSIVNISGTVLFEKATNTAIQAFDSDVDISGEVEFRQSYNSAIRSLNSKILLAGKVLFWENIAYQGGAMFLCDSHVAVAENSRVIFQRNDAEHLGGAIFDCGSGISKYLLFGEFGQSNPISFSTSSRVEFINNTAESGGNAMYGITVFNTVCERCSDEHTYHSLLPVLSIEPDFSAVSSDPLRVYICRDQSTPDCLAILPEQNITQLHYTVYPGQTFTIPAAVVGFNFAPTDGLVYAQFLNLDASLGSVSQHVQPVLHYGCSQLLYSVLSSNKQETLVLTSADASVTEIPRIEQSIRQRSNILARGSVFHLAGSVKKELQDTPVFISITLLDCPLGFTLSELFPQCNCDDNVLENYLTCNIIDQTIQRDGTIWINASFNGTSSDGVIIHQHCPFGYCKPEPVNVDLSYPDTQCAFNHSGILCGACKSNFSLALGGSQCLPNCSNSYVALLIPFALAGFALVFFIKILNLTVSQGTINGLIFYANIVAANRDILFPFQYNKFLSILSVFISWLNLDLGIETCFIKGLDGYWKTWLQFVFPFYVLAIAGAVILLSYYLKRAAKVFGQNSLSVFATMFLFAFVKLLRVAMTIFSFTSIASPPDYSTTVVWAYDGNIRYLSPMHISLFLFALAIVLLLWLPYTAVLLSAPWLRTQTHRKGLRWLKPILDTYNAPFKDKHHYWFGVLLLVRGILFILFASFTAIETNVSLLLISIFSILLVGASMTGGFYKQKATGFLENSFFLNLGVLATGTLYVRLVGGSQEALLIASIGIAFLQFAGIVVFHCHRFFIMPLIRRRRPYQHVQLDTQTSVVSSSSSDGDEFQASDVAMHPGVELSQSDFATQETVRVHLPSISEEKPKHPFVVSEAN